MHETTTPNGCTATCRNLRPEDYPDAKQIINDAFGQAVRANPRVLEVLHQEPWYDPDHLLVAEVEGRVVSLMGVRDGLLTNPGIGVPAGLVGTVCTAAALRGLGIGAELMRASFEHMKLNGLALSYLHTSSERFGFYSRLGYRKAIMANPRLILHLSSLDLNEKPGDQVAERTSVPGDAEALHRIYETHYGEHVSGSWSRTVPFWTRRLQQQPKLFGPPPMTFRVAGPDHPVAYIAILEATDSGTIGEWACLPGSEENAVGLLSSTLRTWRDRGMETAQLAIPSCHPLRPFIDRLSPDDQTGDSVVWLRVQDCELYLETIRPLLEHRAEKLGLRVEISFGDHGGTLAVGRGEPLNLELDVSDLCSLIYNGRRLTGLLDEGDLRVSEGDGAALPSLFPDTGAARCAQDAY
jgi:predicted N-acetyltransferase YhbS